MVSSFGERVPFSCQRDGFIMDLPWYTLHCKAGVHTFSKNLLLSRRRQIGDMKEIPYGGPKDIRRQSTKFSRPGLVHPCSK
jgi:hypothetical protein